MDITSQKHVVVFLFRLCIRFITLNHQNFFGFLFLFFVYFDFADGSGHISVEKLQRACTLAGIKFTLQELEEMIEEADVNGDGHVDQSEFVRIMLQTNLF